MQLNPVLVIGATGYIGGRLVQRLLTDGHRVKAVARSADKLAARHWAKHPLVELVEADAHNKDALLDACEGTCFCRFISAVCLKTWPPGSVALSPRGRARYHEKKKNSTTHDGDSAIKPNFGSWEKEKVSYV